MHDIGNAGMVRGPLAIWNTEMIWLLATLTMTIGACAATELLFSRHAVRRRAAADKGTVSLPIVD